MLTSRGGADADDLRAEQLFLSLSCSGLILLLLIIIIIILVLSSVVNIPRPTDRKNKFEWLEVRFSCRRKKNCRIVGSVMMVASLWNKYGVLRKSPEISSAKSSVKRSPKVARKERALELNAPRHSTAMGWKISSYRPVYFASFGLAARSAAAPAKRGEHDKYEAASVLITVTFMCYLVNHLFRRSRTVYSDTNKSRLSRYAYVSQTYKTVGHAISFN